MEVRKSVHPFDGYFRERERERERDLWPDNKGTKGALTGAAEFRGQGSVFLIMIIGGLLSYQCRRLSSVHRSRK